MHENKLTKRQNSIKIIETKKPMTRPKIPKRVSAMNNVRDIVSSNDNRTSEQSNYSSVNTKHKKKSSHTKSKRRKY